MAIRNILPKRNPALRKVCRPVTKVDDRLVQLIEDMTETMLEADGVGLAAPQVGVLRRIVVVYDIDHNRTYELINPEIVFQEGQQHEVEGCLSIPGEYGYTDRPMKVRAKGLNREGKPVEVEGEGLLARAICHEIDHLNGILFTDHAEMVDAEEYLKQLEKES